MWKTIDFINQKPMVIRHFSKKSITEDTICEYCTLVGIPIIVVCDFLMEEFPESKDLCQKKIADIKQFYGIK